MNTPSVLLAGALACVLLPGCLALPLGSATCQHPECVDAPKASVPVEASSAEPDAWARSFEEPSVLYSRDGKPVQRESTVASVPAEPAGLVGTRDVERPETGRLYLLELYQQAVDERDDLLDEVMRQEAFLLELRAANAALETQVAEVQAHSITLEADKQRAEQKSFELASRVTAAQIGRLQAELRQLRAQAGELDPMGLQPTSMEPAPEMQMSTDSSMQQPERRVK